MNISTRWNRLAKDGKKTPGIVFVLADVIDAIVIILAVLVVNMVIVSIGGIMGSVLEDTLASDLRTLPGFDYSVYPEGGNELFSVYDQFRWAAYVMLAAGLVIAVTFHYVMGGSKFWRQKGMSIFISVLVIAAFPFIWDISSLVLEDTTSILLNPLYTLDDKSPCPDTMTDQEIITMWNESPYNHGDVKTGSVGLAQDVCRPDLKVNYLIRQMSKNTEYDSGIDRALRQPFVDPLEWFTLSILDTLFDSITGLASDTMFALIKSLIVIQFALMALLVAIMTDMLTAMIAAAVPILLILRLVPLFQGVADKFLFALPALFILPLFSAVILTIGASVVASPDAFPGTENYVGPVSMALLYSWISALGSLFLAVMLPLLFVPMLTAKRKVTHI